MSKKNSYSKGLIYKTSTDALLLELIKRGLPVSLEGEEQIPLLEIEIDEDL